MSKNTWKLVMASVLASSGFVAFACGGGSDEGKGAQTPSAGTAETSAPATGETASSAAASAAPTATTPPAPTLPDSFKAADDARKAAEGKVAAITAKKGACPALAADVKKFAKDNAAAFETWNTEFGKLDDGQKGLVQTKPATEADVTAMFETGTTKACAKDKAFKAATKDLVTAAMKGLPGAAAPAGSGSAAGAASAAPSSSGAKAKPKK